MNVNVYLNDYICSIHIDTDYTDIDTDLSVYYNIYIYVFSLSLYIQVYAVYVWVHPSCTVISKS